MSFSPWKTHMQHSHILMREKIGIWKMPFSMQRSDTSWPRWDDRGCCGSLLIRMRRWDLKESTCNEAVRVQWWSLKQVCKEAVHKEELSRAGLVFPDSSAPHPLHPSSKLVHSPNPGALWQAGTFKMQALVLPQIPSLRISNEVKLCFQQEDQ